MTLKNSTNLIDTKMTPKRECAFKGQFRCHFLPASLSIRALFRQTDAALSFADELEAEVGGMWDSNWLRSSQFNWGTWYISLLYCPSLVVHEIDLQRTRLLAPLHVKHDDDLCQRTDLIPGRRHQQERISNKIEGNRRNKVNSQRQRLFLQTNDKCISRFTFTTDNCDLRSNDYQLIVCPGRNGSSTESIYCTPRFPLLNLRKV